MTHRSSNEQTLVERLRDCVKVTFSAGLHGVESDCRQAAEELDRQRAEIERLTEDNASLESEQSFAIENGKRLRAEIERLRGALELANQHFRVLYPRGAEEGDYICKAVRDALSSDGASAHETTANRCVHGFSAVGCAQCDRDASKWRALRNCARITSMGSAGLLPEDTESDYAHLTLNFWTGVPPESPGPTWARDWLDKFVAKALHASPSEKAKEPQQTATNFECPECGAAVPHGMTCHHNL